MDVRNTEGKMDATARCDTACLICFDVRWETEVIETELRARRTPTKEGTQ